MQKIYKFLGDIQGLSIKKGSENPFFESKYMNLDDIMKSINPLLKKAGLVLAHYGDGDNLITAIIDPESGDKLESKLRITLTDPQKIGACVTYFRRYNTCALLNILSDEDDDGNKASGKEEPRKVSTAASWDQAPFQKEEAISNDLGKCEKCGAGMKMSKAGKPYCGNTCWKK